MAEEKSETEEWIGTIGALIFLGVMAWLVVTYGCNAVWYSTKNGVSADHTHVDAKPGL